MSKHIFLSYSRKNTDMMRQIDRTLRSKGIKTWTDDQLVPGTSQWKTAIEKAIEQAGAIVALMSPDAKNSEWVDRELEYARMRNIPVIPILVDGDAISSVPFELVSSQWIDIAGEGRYVVGAGELVKTVLGFLGLKAKTKYQLLHDELVQFVTQLPHARWAGVISIDGLTVGFYSTTTTIEEDRVSAMSAGSIAFSERVSSALEIGSLRFVVTSGSRGAVFTVVISDELVLMFALDQCPSIDKVISVLSDAIKPLCEVLDITNPTFF